MDPSTTGATATTGPNRPPPPSQEPSAPSPLANRTRPLDTEIESSNLAKVVLDITARKPKLGHSNPKEANNSASVELIEKIRIQTGYTLNSKPGQLAQLAVKYEYGAEGFVVTAPAPIINRMMADPTAYTITAEGPTDVFLRLAPRTEAYTAKGPRTKDTGVFWGSLHPDQGNDKQDVLEQTLVEAVEHFGLEVTAFFPKLHKDTRSFEGIYMFHLKPIGEKAYNMRDFKALEHFKTITPPSQCLANVNLSDDFCKMYEICKGCNKRDKKAKQTDANPVKICICAEKRGGKGAGPSKKRGANDEEKNANAAFAKNRIMNRTAMIKWEE